MPDSKLEMTGVSCVNIVAVCVTVLFSSVATLSTVGAVFDSRLEMTGVASCVNVVAVCVSVLFIHI